MGEARWVGIVTLISRGVEISIAGGGGEIVCALGGGHFFRNHAFIVLRYEKPHAALAMERTKPMKHKTYNKGKSRHQ